MRVLKLLTVLLLISFACKDENRKVIPYASVSTRINPNSTFYLGLNNIGGWDTLIVNPPDINPPSRGIIVYRYSLDEFKAFERTCPYDPDISEAIVRVNETNLIAVCPVCSSRYILTDGSPTEESTGKTPLKQFYATYDGSMVYIND